MKRFLLAALAAAALNAYAACEDKFAYSKPVVKGDYTELCRSGYATLHDNKKKIPLASFEHLSPTTLSKQLTERKNSFREDKDVRPDARARLDDYKTGADTYDRGHLANAEDAANSTEMHDTFLLSNMVPQVKAFNRGMWRALEMRVRKMAAIEGRDLYVITGSYNDPTLKTKTIGKGVVVPDELFKIIIDKQKGEAIAYVIPNAVSNKSYKAYEVTINDLVNLTGIDLVPGAPEKLRSTNSASLR